MKLLSFLEDNFVADTLREHIFDPKRTMFGVRVTRNAPEGWRGLTNDNES